MKDLLKTVAAIFRCYNKKMWVLALGQGIFFCIHILLYYGSYFSHIYCKLTNIYPQNMHF